MERYAVCLRFLVLGCVVSLAVGCSTVSSKRYVSTAVPKPVPHVPPTSLKAKQQDTTAPKRNVKSELTIPSHPTIDAWVYRLTTEQRGSFQISLQRAMQYIEPLHEIFESRGLPKELVFLAQVESGFSPVACSPSNAVGMWQFIDSTGKNYGLQQTDWIDERRDPYKAARAAADYLSFLYDTFDDWSLALAAYNAGENGVKRTMLQTGLQTYWELIENGYLPSETRDYVPKILATIKIISQPDRYGFKFDPQGCKPWYETVVIPGGVSLYLLGNLIGVPESKLISYNPELSRPMTPMDTPKYELRIPVGKKKNVVYAVERISRDKMLGFIRHKINGGETLFQLAKKYGCSVQALASFNGMKPMQPIKKEQVLNIPIHSPLAIAELQKQNTMSSSATFAAEKSKPTRLAQVSLKEFHYPVRQGDTLWSISQRFGVPLHRLSVCNDLSQGFTIAPGDVLTICPGAGDS